MGLIGRVLNWVTASGRSVPGRQVLVALGARERLTADVYPPLNTDVQGLPGDLPYCASGTGTGRRVALGWLEQVAQQFAEPGELRTYGRNDEGVTVCEVWLKNDGTLLLNNSMCSFELTPNGTITGSNNAGSFTLQTNGDLNANGARMTVDGDVVTSDGKSLRNHTHTQGNDSAGNTQVPTNPPS